MCLIAGLWWWSTLWVLTRAYAARAAWGLRSHLPVVYRPCAVPARAFHQPMIDVAHTYGLARLGLDL
jgi:hypothetical protein